MRLGKVGYYGDFVVYPIAISGLAVYAIWTAAAGGWTSWLGAFVSGAALWTLVAAADVALILVSAGVLALIALASLAVVAVASVGTWRHLRRGVAGSQVVGSQMATNAAVRMSVRCFFARSWRLANAAFMMRRSSPLTRSSSQ